MKIKRTGRRLPKTIAKFSFFCYTFFFVLILVIILIFAYIKNLYSVLYIAHAESGQTSRLVENKPSEESRKTMIPSAAAGVLNKERLPFLKQGSEYAYVTLISGIDASFRYRGFLYNALIMKRALKLDGSTADFIALIGYNQNDTIPFWSDIDLLTTHGIIVNELPRLLDPALPLSFAEMALLKITPWSFTTYKRIQFFDGDVMPLKNMDCFFNLDVNTFTVGAVSPLNSGWYVAIPDNEAFLYMREKAVWRLKRDWDTINGWSEPIPKRLTYRGGKDHVEKWEFNGADMDQGLLTHYFVICYGKGMLIDTVTKKALTYKKGLNHASEKQIDMKKALNCCRGISPMMFFAHFTGRSKPWMVDLTKLEPTKKNEHILKWAEHLDALHLPVTSKTLFNIGLGSPLGFFNAKFPKGGYKDPVK